MEPDILRQFEALNAAYFANAGAREGGSESESESERRSESGSEADDIEHAIEAWFAPLYSTVILFRQVIESSG